jgi:hypothetical protein
MNIEELNLAPIAEAAARILKQKHPEVVFTSGRRNIADQAHAMASNVALGNRHWIEQTYVASPVRDALQAWVNAHPSARTVDQIAQGLETTMNAMTPDQVGKISKHLSGMAFDVKPTNTNAEAIKRTIRSLPNLHRFLEKEAGLVRWHAQFSS